MMSMMSMMKRALVAAALTAVLCAPLSAQAAEASRVCIFTPDTENVDGAEKAWLHGSVRDAA